MRPDVALVACLLVIASMLAHPVLAHMVVLPAESEAGGWERYELIVPTEKASPTVRVQVVLPVGMEVVAVESKDGWQGVYRPFPLGAATVQRQGGQGDEAHASATVLRARTADEPDEPDKSDKKHQHHRHPHKH